MDISLSWKWKVSMCYLKPLMSLNCRAQKSIKTQAGDIELSHQTVIVYCYMMWTGKLYLDTGDSLRLLLCIFPCSYKG